MKCKTDLKSALMVLALTLIGLQSCYKLEDLTPDFEDGVSNVIYDLPGDTLATDGWDPSWESGDLYLRQRFYNSSWTDSIRFVPVGNEVINSSRGVDVTRDGKSADVWMQEVLVREKNIQWLSPATAHPSGATENQAYRNSADNLHYIRRSNTWYQMEIVVDSISNPVESVTIDWRGFMQQAPPNPQTNWAYRNNRNNRVYRYNGKAWELLTRPADYRQNMDFVEVQFSKSGKEAGLFSPFIFRFADKWQHFLRDNADSTRYLRTDEWDLAFTGDMNSMIYLNNGLSPLSPGNGSPIRRSSVIMYEYGYEFMHEAPEDEFFDNRPVNTMQIGFESQYGPGINSWYQIGNTFIAKPFPYRAYYIRLERIDPNTGERSFRYGKLQLISMYKGAPEVLTDANWPSPYITMRYYIQPDGSRNLRTND